MKKALWGLAIIVVLVGGVALFYREEIGMALAFRALQPNHTFASQRAAAEPNYADLRNWAALPDRQDAADVVPDGTVTDNQATADVDVFFVHPTTYFQPEHWNQPLDDARTNNLTDEFVLKNQASVFNSCCRVYAPRYRQATIYSFMDSGTDGTAALDLAYQDVERAFDYFIANFNHERPFILAGHSQGSVHIRRLLEKRITGTALAHRLVAAYPVGFPINQVEYAKAVPDVPVCATAEQTGCLVTWNSVGPKAASFGDPSQNVCVNPLSWHTDGKPAARETNLGAVTYQGGRADDITNLAAVPEKLPESAPVLEAGVADAWCMGGLLQVREIRSEHYGARPMGRDNYHIYDYSLFHMSIRRNAEVRVRHYQEQHSRTALAANGG
jgi:hypothetical protein